MKTTKDSFPSAFVRLGGFLFNVVLYGFLGYWLERVINLIFLGGWVDNRVLWLPVQPMYGLGVALTIVVWTLLAKRALPLWAKLGVLVPLAIAFTAISELVSGHMYERLFGRLLWDYRDTFTLWCGSPHSCIIPTSLFGILSVWVAVGLHPWIRRLIDLVPTAYRRWIGATLVVAVAIDFLLTYTSPFLHWIGGV